MNEGEFNLFDFSGSLNPLKSAVGEKKVPLSQGIPSSPSPAVGTYSPPTDNGISYASPGIRKKNVVSTKTVDDTPFIWKLRKDEVDFLLGEGYTNDEILDIAGLEEEKTKEKSFSEKVGESAKSRFESALSTQKEEGFSDLTKGAAAAWELAGFAGDVVWAGISALTPKEVKDALSYAGGKVAEYTPEVVKEYGKKAIAKWMEGYGEFVEANPETGRNLKSAFQIGSAVPVVKGIKGVGSIAWNVGEKAVEVAKSAPSVAKSAYEDLGSVVYDKAGKILKRKEIAEGTAIYGKDGKLIGTKASLDAKARQLSWAEGSAYDAKLAIQTAKSFTKEEIDAIEKASLPEVKTSEILGNKIKKTAELQAKVADSNKTPITREMMEEVSPDGVVRRNYVSEGINKLLKDKEKWGVGETAELLRLRNKLDTEGYLSAKEISELSIKMGEKSKAFKTSINWVIAKDEEFERIRKGVKDAYRKNSAPEAVELDKTLHANITTKEYLDELAESNAKVRAARSNSVALKFWKVLASTPIVGNPLRSISRGFARAEVGGGKITDVMMEGEDYADKIAENLRKIQKLTHDVETSNTDEEALKYIAKAENEFASKSKFPILPSWKNTVQSANVVNVSPIALPSSITKNELSRAVIRNPQKASEEAFKKGLEEGKKTIKKPSPKPTKPAIKKNVPKKKPMKI